MPTAGGAQGLANVCRGGIPRRVLLGSCALGRVAKGEVQWFERSEGILGPVRCGMMECRR